mmetsp:Transcript_47796/g.84151  ORF Transcript_47796/g.84151 Transcript_47796/m.84151 type:complete len:94 (-) Transcript_47796:29-310(-)
MVSVRAFAFLVFFLVAGDAARVDIKKAYATYTKLKQYEEAMPADAKVEAEWPEKQSAAYGIKVSGNHDKVEEQCTKNAGMPSSNLLHRTQTKR